jgi:CRISPR-associated protein Cas5d
MLKSGDARICPTMVEVCRLKGATGGTVQFQSYTTNYGGPLRKSDLIRTGNRMQVFATILAGVCYRLYGDIRARLSARQ